MSLIWSELRSHGGAGFIGSHIARRLLDEGDLIRIVDDYSSGSEQNLSDMRVRERVVRGDLREYSFARDSLKNVDTVIILPQRSAASNTCTAQQKANSTHFRRICQLTRTFLGHASRTESEKSSTPQAFLFIQNTSK